MKIKLTLLALVGMASTAMGQTWNFSDFANGNSNPGSGWGLNSWDYPGNQGAWNQGTAYTKGTSPDPQYADYWTNSGHNNSGLVGPTFIAPAAGLFDTHVFWTAPAAGTYQVSFNLGGTFNPGSDGLRYDLFDGNSWIGGAQDLAPGQPLALTFTTNVNAGAVVLFTLNSGLAGDNASDVTGFSGTVTAVPEPSASLLSILGVLGLLSRRRRA